MVGQCLNDLLPSTPHSPLFLKTNNLQHWPLLQDDELRQALQTMWDYEGSGPYQEVNEPDHEWGDEGEWDWEEVKEETDDYGDGVMEPKPHDPWDASGKPPEPAYDENPQNRWDAKRQTWPPPPPPPPPPETGAQGAQTWSGWNEWKGGDGKWNTTWKSNWNKNWTKKWNPKAPWASQKKAKPDGQYTKGGGFTDHDGTWWPFLDSNYVFYSNCSFLYTCYTWLFRLTVPDCKD